MNLDGCCALITGASAGIGREIARQLAPRALRLILIARREERLEELRAELNGKYPTLQVQTRRADLSDLTGIHSLTDWLRSGNLEVGLLVNNAGLGDLGPFVTANPRRLEEMVLVNMNALTLLTRAVLPQMIAKGRGAILNVSSCASFLPIANFAVYAASKAYVTSFNEALRAELRDKGISVTALCPGPVHTEFTDVAYRPGSIRDAGPEFAHVSAQRVAELGLQGIEQDKAVVIPGVVMKVAMFFTRITPMPILRLASNLSAKRT
jgi:short-subunit dehydrogenase